MKVSTDSIILGSWIEVGGSNRILDIGSGSRLISLILAQNSLPEAKIDGVEFNAEAVQQARQNVQSSPCPQKFLCLKIAFKLI